ncbi:MAG: TaqI-like C-terminal specificity domain-containing protein [Brumimicrobium sp.]
MKLALIKPKKALNKAYLKVKPIRSDMELFKKNLIDLLDNSNDTESEEFHKNLVADFLKRTYYEPNYFINTKGRNDLVIHNGSKAKDPVGVILEAKKPTNKSEMVSETKPNTKALQELVLYYLRERITSKNLEVKNLVITNIYEWYIFDANDFEQYFAQNKALVKQFQDFENGSLSGTSTDFFYKEIASPVIEAIKDEIECTYFDIRKFEKPLRNDDLKDDVKLVSLFKLLSPEHVLKKPFTNDSNNLDKSFYSELLHIIGLTETKEGSKKVIERNKSGERNTGSFLEDAIIQLDSLDKISRMDKPSQYGTTSEERLFNVGLELSITWVNRILFLKLLEAQLITYHGGDKKFGFLNFQRISSYDDLNSLFFQVLAKRYDERNEDVKKAFENVPYLNSSLFEPTEIEHSTLLISNLRDDKTLPILSNTVLKDAKGKRRSGELSTLEYLFEFLNAYDFSGEGAENIQEDNKTLINASVLGLIFEKINGYKDGSFFTPGFITMYMCKETIRKAIVQKFNEASLTNTEPIRPKVETSPPLEGDKGGGKYQDIDDIYNAIGTRGDFSHKQANALINDVKTCDPAVGSGHFLVSALNEMIAVKHDLGVLHDRNGRLLRDYNLEVVNDELIVTDVNGELFEYNFNNKESQRLQETLFHEKQTIIENCLFGVDINPNSVKICRLRLWIELLKNAYYKNETELETLPNIDINIKCGNSLISRFDLDADLSKALRQSKWNMTSYRTAVQTYRNAESKDQKREMERLIADIKGDFKTEISQNSKEQKQYDKFSAELYEKYMTPKLLDAELNRSQKAKQKKERKKLEKKVTKLKEQLEEIKNNKIYENAFEWRFEFPEVLDDVGNYVGFDVVIGNPPYFIMTKNNTNKNELEYYNTKFRTIRKANSKNIFNLFIELGVIIGDEKAYSSMIVPEGLFETRSYLDTIKFLNEKGTVNNITQIEGMVFDEANTGNVIFIYSKGSFSENTVEFMFNENQELTLLEKSIDPVINKLEKGELAPLKEVCMVFKGMVVSDRKNHLFDQSDDINKDKFLLGNCISKWNINKSFYTDYKSLKIVGGTKLKSKHDVYPRILIRRTGDHICSAYLEEPALTESTLYSCWSIIDEVETKFIFGLLHSKLMNYYLKNKFITNKQAFPQILMTDLQLLPIATNDLQAQGLIVDLVNQIMSVKQNNSQADISSLECEIDVLVYKLYNLSYEEVKVVDEEFWMSENEYEKVEI